MAGDACGDLEITAVSQVLGDAGAAEAVGADFAGEAGAGGSALDHLEGSDAGHRPVEEGVVSPERAGPEKGAAAIFGDAGGGEVGVDVGLGGMAGGDDVLATVFLVEAEERARSLGVVVGHAHGDRGRDTREAVDQHAEERAVGETCERRDVDAIEKGPGLRGREYRGLAGVGDVLRPAHRARGIEGEDLADHEPVEEHAQRRQVLLDARG